MALVSPGVQVSVIDESFYTPAEPGTVPMIFVVSAQDKKNGAGTGTATATTSANSEKPYLVTSQRKDGTWQEPHFTGCGFPGYGIGDLPKAMKNSAILNNQGEELAKGFMIKYHLYSNYFPLDE